MRRSFAYSSIYADLFTSYARMQTLYLATPPSERIHLRLHQVSQLPPSPSSPSHTTSTVKLARPAPRTLRHPPVTYGLTLLYACYRRARTAYVALFAHRHGAAAARSSARCWARSIDQPVHQQALPRQRHLFIIGFVVVSSPRRRSRYGHPCSHASLARQYPDGRVHRRLIDVTVSSRRE